MNKKLKILDLGCGDRKIKNSIGIDIANNSKADIIHDLNTFPYPFEDNEFDIIYANHILEHLKDKIKVMEELYRILKPNGKLIIRAPHFSSVNAWSNPTHINSFCLSEFYYFDHSRDLCFSDALSVKCDFRIRKKQLLYLRLEDEKKYNILIRVFARLITYFANLSHLLCERVWCYWMGGFSELYIELEAIK